METTKEIPIDENLVSYCGLYCGACSRYQKGKCKGCRVTAPSWCKVGPCNQEHGTSTCAECKVAADVSECKIYNPFFVRVFEKLSKGSRRDGILFIKANGRLEFAKHMSEKKLVSIEKSGK